jgi:(E)-4-hydroxy-3-methylbut-2-enyl-diphosphate synthase
VDLIDIARQVSDRLEGMRAPVSVAVMGCVVNGPGEARDADLGVACGNGQGLLFENGKPLRKVAEDKIVDELVSEIKSRYED